MVLKLVDGKLCFDEQLLLNIQQKNNDVVLQILTKEIVCSNVSDSTGSTLLHFASEYGNAEVVQHLLNFGVNVNSKDELGRTPLSLAVARSNEDISIETINFLLKANADFLKPNVHGKYPLLHQIVNHEFSNRTIIILKDVFEKFKEHCQNNNSLMADLLMKANCPLDRAMYLGNAGVTEIMIKSGCKVNIHYTQCGQTALHVAASLCDELNIKLLLAHGANATARSLDDFLPLSWYFKAAVQPPYRRNLEIVKALLAHYFTAADKLDETIISLRDVLQKGNQEEIQYVLQFDIDLSIKDNEGRCMLLYFIANKFAKWTGPFRGKVSDVNVRNGHLEYTPLHYVSLTCNPDIVKFLLDNGADVHAKSVGGYTPLWSFFCNLTNIFFLQERQILELMLEHGAEIQQVSRRKKMTLIDVLLKLERFDLGKILVAHLALREKLGQPITDMIRKKIDAYQQLSNHYDLCQQQLEDLKNIVVYESINLFKLLTQNKKEITRRYAYSDELLEEFKNFDAKYVSNNSNYYSGILKARIESVLPKMKLIRDATKIIFNQIVPQLNNNFLVVRKIIDCLDDDDLKNLNKI